jgi:hypothetical protein
MRTKVQFKVVLLLFCLTLVAMTFAPRVSADDWDRETKVTFKQPVEIPGPSAQVLPPGTYVFKVLDSLSDRHIVQIFNEDMTHLFATILAIPNYRWRATDKTVMTFRERAEGQPQAIRTWFYPGRNWGDEFVYPKSRAIQLAKLVNEPVLALPDELAPNIVLPVKSADEAPVKALAAAPIVAVKPTGEEVPVAEVVVPPPATAEKMPATSSPLPLLGLIGLLSLGAGAILSAFPKRSA